MSSSATINNIHELEVHMSKCEDCILHKTRNKVVFGSGNTINPSIVVTGEGPGEDENLSGLPFVGKAGKKLDKMFAYAGIKREEIYICNAVLCKCPNNRNPTREELNACKWRLDLQLSYLKPKLIIALGKIALEQLFGAPIKGALNQYFDKFIPYGETQILSTYHPSFHLRSPDYAYKIGFPHWKVIKEWLENERNRS